jgi:hypothetical protein
MDNLTDIVNQIVESDAYFRRKIIIAILKGSSGASEFSGDGNRPGYQDD